LVVFNAYELLHVAKQQAHALAESGYRPPPACPRIQVAGDVGIATFKMMLVNMLEGRFISPHDYEIALASPPFSAVVIVDRGALVDEDLADPAGARAFRRAGADARRPQERIAHMLKTGKPLRN
jgi:3-hydroxyacyl-CoA dehydrogenase